MENKMIIETKLGMLEYLNVVNEIAGAYFDEDENYQPHIGLVNAMKVFYNTCVRKSRFDEEIDHEITEVEDVSKIFSDEEFIEKFNAAIIVGSIRMDFANAFRDALDIVNTGKGAIGWAIRKIKKMIESVSKEVSEVVTPENIEMIKSLRDMLQKGEFTVDKFIESYGNSKMFQQLLSSGIKDNEA